MGDTPLRAPTRRAYQSLFRSVNEPRASSPARQARVPLFLALLCLMVWDLGTEPSAASVPERVEYESTDGFLLSAQFYRPDSSSSEGAILFTPPGVDQDQWTSLTAALVERGAHVLVPDLRGIGGSQQRTGRRRELLDLDRVDWSDAWRDGLAAALFLEREANVPWDKLLLGGSGIGATVAILSALRLPTSPQALLLVGPELGAEGLDPRPLLDGVHAPALLIAAEENRSSFDVARSLYVAHQKSCVLWQLKDAGRGTAFLRRPDVSEDVALWLCEPPIEAAP